MKTVAFGLIPAPILQTVSLILVLIESISSFGHFFSSLQRNASRMDCSRLYLCTHGRHLSMFWLKCSNCSLLASPSRMSWIAFIHSAWLVHVCFVVISFFEIKFGKFS